MRYSLKRTIKQAVRDLRKRQTKAEQDLWVKLRNRQLKGKKFLRQHPIVFEWEGRERFFVADFYCHEAGLIIELDGKIHEKQKDYDKLRDFVLNNFGLKVIRFTNTQLNKDSRSVLTEIAKFRSLYPGRQALFLVPSEVPSSARHEVEGLREGVRTMLEWGEFALFSAIIIKLKQQGGLASCLSVYIFETAELQSPKMR